MTQRRRGRRPTKKKSRIRRGKPLTPRKEGPVTEVSAEEFLRRAQATDKRRNLKRKKAYRKASAAEKALDPVLFAGGNYNPRRLILVTEYLKDFDKKRAYFEAGYGDKDNPDATPYSSILALFNLPNIKNAITYQMKQYLNENASKKFRVIRELTRLATIDIRKLYNKGNILKDIRELDDETASAVAGLKTKRDREGDLVLDLKTWDKLGAIKEMNKYLGLVGNTETPTDKDPREAAAEQKQWLDTMFDSIPDEPEVEEEGDTDGE